MRGPYRLLDHTDLKRKKTKKKGLRVLECPVFIENIGKDRKLEKKMSLL